MHRTPAQLVTVVLFVSGALAATGAVSPEHPGAATLAPAAMLPGPTALAR